MSEQVGAGVAKRHVLARQQDRRSLRSIGPRPDFAAAVALVCLAAFACGAARAAGQSSIPPAKAQVSLISAGGLDHGRYHLGIDVTLSPGALTYWRFPGDAGVPPTFDFSGSKNVGRAAPRFPAPRRFVEQGATAYGYKTEVVFPIDVTPKDPARPSRLRVDFGYATCDVLCVPARSLLSMDLRPGAPASADALQVALWRSRVPRPMPPSAAPRATFVPGAADPTWRIDFPEGKPGGDLFVEAPDGWFMTSKPSGPSGFLVAAVQRPQGPPSPVEVALTYVDADRAFETRLRLDAGRS